MTWLIEILKIFKDLIASDKVLCNKAFNIAKNLKHDMFLLQWFQNFLMKYFLAVLLHAQINLLLEVPLR